LLRAIRLLPTPNYSIPLHLVPITILHSSLPNLLSMSTPLFLKNYIAVDPVLNPSAWSFFSFISTCLELGVRFPLETVLRRAQIATFTSPALRQKNLDKSDPSQTRSLVRSNTGEVTEIETIVPTPKSYRGIVGTMWSVVYEEGLAPRDSPSSDTDTDMQSKLQKHNGQRRRKPGQGVQGLYRGWRIGMWGLAGVWGAGFLSASMGNGEEEIMSSAPGIGYRVGGQARQF
jgi:fusion and transport protein UGO1